MLRLTDLLQIDDDPLPVPTQQMELSYKDIVSSDSGRDEAGVMHREVLRYHVMTCKLTWDLLNDETYDYILRRIAGKETFRFRHPRIGSSKETVEDICYAEAFDISLNDPKKERWRGLQLNIYQC